MSLLPVIIIKETNMELYHQGILNPLELEHSYMTAGNDFNHEPRLTASYVARCYNFTSFYLATSLLEVHAAIYLVAIVQKLLHVICMPYIKTY